jgi:hypothetical protein
MGITTDLADYKKLKAQSNNNLIIKVAKTDLMQNINLQVSCGVRDKIKE